MTLYLHGVAGEQLENLRVDQWGWRTWRWTSGTGGPGGGPEGGPVEVQDQGLQPDAPVLQVVAAHWIPSFYQQVMLGVFIPLIPKSSSRSETKL